MLGVPPPPPPPNTLPLVIYIGIFCYWVLLRYNMSFKTIASGFKGEVQYWDRGRSSIKIKSLFELETIIRNYSLYFSKVFFSNIDSETAEI